MSLGIVVAGFLVALFVAVARAEVLPAKFSFDGQYIQRLAHTSPPPGVDRSYLSTAAMYRLLGLQDTPLAVGVITVLVLGALVFIVLLGRPDGVLPIPIALFAAVALVIGSVYLGTYSKDAPVLVVSAALLVLGRSRWAEMGVVAVVAAYAAIFRSYWFLVLMVYLVVRLAQRLWPHRPVWVLAALISIIAIGFGIEAGTHQSADYFRSMVNVTRLGDSDAVTMIHRFVELPAPLGGTGNVVITFFTLFLPLPLLTLGGYYYVGVCVLIAGIWGSFWWAAMRTAPLRRDPSSRLRASSLVVGFAVVQAFFEPDYGSALRHLAPLLPVVLMVVLSAVRDRPASPRPASRVAARIDSGPDLRLREHAVGTNVESEGVALPA